MGEESHEAKGRREPEIWERKGERKRLASGEENVGVGWDGGEGGGGEKRSGRFWGILVGEGGVIGNGIGVNGHKYTVFRVNYCHSCYDHKIKMKITFKIQITDINTITSIILPIPKT